MPANIAVPADVSNPIILADWLEILALTSDDGNASHGDLQRTLNTLSVNDLDEICTECMGELNRRVSATRDKYPFTFSGTLLKTKGDWRDYIPYVFCLLLSHCDDETKKIVGLKHEVLFEELSCLAARNFLGGEVLRFGTPRKELPSGFREALAVVCGKVNEWTPTTNNTLRRQDGGLDLIAWKHFPDEQIGKLILFGHCASGDNWDRKVNELQPHDFCSLWLGGDKSPIIKTFFIPRRLDLDMFNFHAVSAKLFFDRCRIAYWVPSEDFHQRTAKAPLTWCEKMFERIKN